VRVVPTATRTHDELRNPCPDSDHLDMNFLSERAGDSLRITVSPRVNWLGVLTALTLIAILCGVGMTPALEGLKAALETGGSLGGYILGSAACWY
jgi:hypothetical protein